MAKHKLSKTRACRAVQLLRSSWYREPSQQEARDQPVIDALNAMIEKHPRWGFWMCYDRMRLDGHTWNHKRVYRVYKAMKLNLPRRKKRRLPQRHQHSLQHQLPVLAQGWHSPLGGGAAEDAAAAGAALAAGVTCVGASTGSGSGLGSGEEIGVRPFFPRSRRDTARILNTKPPPPVRGRGQFLHLTHQLMQYTAVLAIRLTRGSFTSVCDCRRCHWSSRVILYPRPPGAISR